MPLGFFPMAFARSIATTHKPGRCFAQVFDRASLQKREELLWVTIFRFCFRKPMDTPVESSGREFHALPCATVLAELGSAFVEGHNDVGANAALANKIQDKRGKAGWACRTLPHVRV
jgi:hypothetical protein